MPQRHHHQNRQSPTQKPDDREQSRLFIEKAREIGADEENSAADELMKRLAKTPAEPRKRNPHHTPV
jgi:hypothetical protein